MSHVLPAMIRNFHEAKFDNNAPVKTICRELIEECEQESDARVGPLDGSWYQCSLRVMALDIDMKIMFGHTSIEKSVKGWEEKTSERRMFWSPKKFNF